MMTPGIRAWLTKLRDEGPSRRPRGNVGYRAAVAGLTDWYVRTKDGRQMPMAEARKIWPHSETDHYWDHIDYRPGESHPECITETGLAALEAAEKGGS